MENREFKLLFAAFLFLLPIYTAQAAVVSAGYSGTIDFITVTGGSDTFSIGLNDISIGSNYSITVNFDDNAAAASNVFVRDSSQVSYNFLNSPYGSNFTINGNSISSGNSEVTVINNITTPPASGIPPQWIASGFPETVSNPIDALYIAGYSDGYQYRQNGLQYAIDFIDLSGVLLSDTTLPTSAPLLSDFDFVFFSLEQWNLGVLEYEASGVLANNLSTVPVPAAVWLFGSGMLMLFGVTKNRGKS